MGSGVGWAVPTENGKNCRSKFTAVRRIGGGDSPPYPSRPLRLRSYLGHHFIWNVEVGRHSLHVVLFVEGFEHLQDLAAVGCVEFNDR